MFSDQHFAVKKKTVVEDAIFMHREKESNERRRTYARFRKCAFEPVWFGQKMSSVVVAVLPWSETF